MVGILTRIARRGELPARLRGLMLAPKREWRVIAAEPSDPIGLYLRLIVPLAAIAPAAKLIAWSLVFGYLSPGIALLAALFAYVLNLAGVFLLAIVAARLAPYFGGEERSDQALKLVAYAATASWLGGIFHLIPVVGLLSLVASGYSLVLLALGAPALLAVPAERSAAYTAAVGFAALCLFALIAGAIAMLFGIAALGMA